MKKRFWILAAAAAWGLALPAAAAEGVSALNVTASYDGDYMEAADGHWVHYFSPRISIDSEGFDALQAAVTAYSDERQEYATASAEEYAEWMRQEDEENLADETDYYLESEVSVRRADSVVFSFNNLESSYSGGAHPNYWYSPQTFSSATGKKLTLADVLTDPSGLPELLEAELLKKYAPDLFLSGDSLAADIRSEMETSGTYTDFVTGSEVPIEAGPAFTLEPRSITFWFSSYELTSYAAGAVDVTLYFSDYPELVKEEYQQAPEAWFLPLVPGEEVRLPDGGNTLMVDFYTEDEYQMDWVFLTEVNGCRKEEEIWGFDFDSWLLHTGGKNYLITEIQMDNDYRELHITDLNGAEGITSGDQIPEAFIFARCFAETPTNPESCLLAHGVDMLSTFRAVRPFCFDENGVPVPLADWDSIPDYSAGEYEMALTTKRSLEVTVVNEAGEAAGKTELPAGTKLHFLRTDSESWVDMTDAEGTIYHLFVEGIWPQQVNGLNAEDVFDGIMYAG